jgi:hypothetical protein
MTPSSTAAILGRSVGIAFDDVPDQREVNAEVFVDQLVAHSRDLAPRDRVIMCPGFR